MCGEWRKNTNKSDDLLVVEMGGQVVGVWEKTEQPPTSHTTCWWWRYMAGMWKGEENPPAIVAAAVV